MSANDESREQQPSTRAWGWMVGWMLLLIVVLYPLSVPPAILCVDQGYIPVSVMRLYDPLEFLYNNFEAVEAFYDWYFKLWGLL